MRSIEKIPLFINEAEISLLKHLKLDFRNYNKIKDVMANINVRIEFLQEINKKLLMNKE